jgi:diaminopimelate epimerase
VVPRHDSARAVLSGGAELKVPFTKIQAIGNDFVLIEPQDLDYTAFAIAASDRRFGIGSDGLLVVSKRAEGEVDLRMFNPDGTEDFCGNGLRCAAFYARRKGWVGEHFDIHHLDRTVPVEADGEKMTVTLPPASFLARDVPVLTTGEEFIDQALHGVVGTSLSTGTAHFIVFVDELPGDDLFRRVSPLIEHDPVFPERTSVMWTKAASPSRLELRIWERGAGETLGCGTGSSAAAAAWARRSGTSGDIVVANPGGDLSIFLEGWRSPIRATSQPEISYSGVFEFAK